MIRVVAAVLLTMLSCFANPDFERGLQAYNQSDWDGAIEAWETIVAQGESSAELEFNLGNAYFRQERVDRAILHYERALKLAPGDSDARRNLLMANRAIVDQITEVPRLEILQSLENARDAMSPKSLNTMLLLFNGLLALCVGAMLYASGSVRDTLRRSSVLIAGLAVVSFLWYGWRSASAARQEAIVMTEKSDVHSSPTDDSTQLFSLHAGTKVGLGETLSGWTEITLADGRKGWIPADEIERI
ncbi:MAG: tetratricopeptide repeat protein [bacterium]|nr:tetratricopeptide repeat protein [bacterium]